MSTRLDRIESLLTSGPCLACANTPRCFMMRAGDEEAEARYQTQMRWRREHCTCGRIFHVRKTILNLPEGAAREPSVQDGRQP